MTSVRRVVVIGAGPSGLSAALELARRQIPVDIISHVSAQRASAVAFRDGISAVLADAAGDSIQQHLTDLAQAAQGLAEIPLQQAMVEAAPSIVGLLARMGVPFDRTAEGTLHAYPSPGASAHRTFAAGSASGQHVVMALDEQLSRFEHEQVRDARGAQIPGEALVRRLIPWDFLGLVQDDSGVAVGIVGQDLRSMTITALPYDAVLLATGGYPGVFGASPGSVPALGAGLAAVFAQGAVLSDVEHVFAQPLAILGPDRLRVLPDFIRAESGRVFTVKEGTAAGDAPTIPERDRVYLAELADLSKPPLPHVAARAIAEARTKSGAVYLDLSHRKTDSGLSARLAAVDTMCQRFAGRGLFAGPIEIAPAITRTLGGLYIDHETDAAGRLLAGSPRNHATSIPGLYAAGSAAGGYHGAAAPAGELLLASIFGGGVAAGGLFAYRAQLAKSAFDLPKSIFDKAQKLADEEYVALTGQNQDSKTLEDPTEIFSDLSQLMSSELGVLSTAEGATSAKATILELRDRVSRAKCSDTSSYRNQGGPFMRHLIAALRVSEAVAVSLLSRRPNQRTFVIHKEAGAMPTGSFEYTCAGKTIAVLSERSVAKEARHD